MKKKILFLSLGFSGVCIATFISAYLLSLGGVIPDSGTLKPERRVSALPPQDFRIDFAGLVNPFAQDRKQVRTAPAGKRGAVKSAPILPPPSYRLKGIVGDQAIIEPIGGGDSLFVSTGESVNGLLIEDIGGDYIVLKEKDRRYRVGLTFWESAD